MAGHPAQSKFRLQRVTRAAVLLPFIVPTVLSTLAWLWMFDATFSVFNWVMRYLWQMEIACSAWC